MFQNALYACPLGHSFTRGFIGSLEDGGETHHKGSSCGKKVVQVEMISGPWSPFYQQWDLGGHLTSPRLSFIIHMRMIIIPTSQCWLKASIHSALNFRPDSGLHSSSPQLPSSLFYSPSFCSSSSSPLFFPTIFLLVTKL